MFAVLMLTLPLTSLSLESVCLRPPSFMFAVLTPPLPPRL